MCEHANNPWVVHFKWCIVRYVNYISVFQEGLVARVSFGPGLHILFLYIPDHFDPWGLIITPLERSLYHDHDIQVKPGS